LSGISIYQKIKERSLPPFLPDVVGAKLLEPDYGVDGGSDDGQVENGHGNAKHLERPEVVNAGDDVGGVGIIFHGWFGWYRLNSQFRIDEFFSNFACTLFSSQKCSFLGTTSLH
jgi:hypothetical protein